MRYWWVIGSLLFAAVAGQASGPPGQADVSPAVREEARQYADFMMTFLGEVHRQYARKEVGMIDLTEAAVQGLYEAARQPLPDHLQVELQRTSDQRSVLRRLRGDLGNNEAIRGTRGILASINALNRVLDPYCGFAGPREFRTLFDDTSFGTGIEFANAPLPNTSQAIEVPQRPGIVPIVPRGITWTGLPDTLQVKTVIPGSPAQKAGLRPGDLISKIDGRPCSQTDAARYFRTFYPNSPDTIPGTAPPKPITLEVRRNDVVTSNVMVAASDFDPESVYGARRKLDFTWDFMIDHQSKLGYIRVGQIALLTASDFQNAVRSLQAQGAKGLVLDLRWCPGGYLREAIMMASTLLPPQSPVAHVVYREPTMRQEEPIADTNPVLDMPVVVLINNETSGGGELIAGALQDHQRAIIAGERTIGKASVQKTLDRNPMGMTYKLTIGTFHRPSGKNLQRFAHSTTADDWGIQPDKGKWLPLSNDVARQLKDQWNNHVLRPAGSKEALPTDDPESDPQLKAALAMLKSKAR